MVDQTMIVNGLHYALSVDGRGDPLLLLHGFTGRGGNWAELCALLSQRFTTIMLDLPGHGDTESPSGPERYRMERCAEDIATILDRLGFDTTHLMGYSMGGRLALYLALNMQRRFRSLILESASPGLQSIAEREARKASDEALADEIEREGIEAFVNRWEALPLFESQRQLDRAVREKLREGRLKNNPVGLANSLRGMGTGVQPALWERLPELKLPTLLLAGELDTKFAAIAGQMHATIPDSHLKVIPDAGHTIHLEKPSVLAQAVLQFTDSLS